MINKTDISAIITLIKDFDYEMLDDAEWNKFRAVDPSKEKQLLNMFNQVVVPEYESMSSSSQERIKSSLAELLSTDSGYQQILDAIEMPFEPIEDPRKFFSILWFALCKEYF